MTTATEPQPPAPSMPPPPRPDRRLTWLWITIAVIVAVPVLLIGLAFAAVVVGRGTVEVVTSQQESAPADAVMTVDGGSYCLGREEAEPKAELCIVRTGDSVEVRATGLQPGSVATITGDVGDTLNLTVESNGHLDADVGGAIIQAEFTVAGLWADGESASLSLDRSE